MRTNTPATYRNRLTRLAYTLEHLPQQRETCVIQVDRFDMYSWAKQGSACGTSACAVGHAMLLPWFNAEGLEAKRIDKRGYRNQLSPVYQGQSGFEAVERFFGIDEATSRHLFDPTYYPVFGLFGITVQPKHVAKRIREVIALEFPAPLPEAKPLADPVAEAREIVQAVSA